MIASIPIISVNEQQENIHTVSLYVGAARQEEYYDFIINLAPKRVIFNPGTENPQFAQKLNKAGISWEMLVRWFYFLRINTSPKKVSNPFSGSNS